MQIPFIDQQGMSGYMPKNLFFTPKKIYGRDALVKRPGLKLFTELPETYKIRAMYATETDIFAVCGTHLYKIDSFGNSEAVGTLLSETSTETFMAYNGVQLMVLDDGTLYMYGPQADEDLSSITGSSGTSGSIGFSRVTSLGFPLASLAYQGGRFVGHAQGTQYFYESYPLDGTNWNQLDYAITTVKPDNLMAVYEVNGDIFAMGKQSGEAYYNSGNSDFSYAKMPGGNIPVGTKAPMTGAVFLGMLVMLTPDRTVVQAATTPIKLSNEHIDRRLNSASSVNNSSAFIFNQSGHSFYVLNVPALDTTFVYDLTSQIWYEWGSSYGRWRPECACKFNDINYVGDFENGKIYILDSETYDDNGDEIIVEHTVPVQKDNNLLTFNSFEVEIEAGVGLITGQGSDPKMMLRYSTDKGATWSYERVADMGKIGKYANRVKWRRLGRHYDFTAKISVSDPVKVVITGAYING